MDMRGVHGPGITQWCDFQGNDGQGVSICYSVTPVLHLLLLLLLFITETNRNPRASALGVPNREGGPGFNGTRPCLLKTFPSNGITLSFYFYF